MASLRGKSTRQLLLPGEWGRGGGERGGVKWQAAAGESARRSALLSPKLARTAAAARRCYPQSSVRERCVDGRSSLAAAAAAAAAARWLQQFMACGSPVFSHRSAVALVMRNMHMPFGEPGRALACPVDVARHNASSRPWAAKTAAGSAARKLCPSARHMCRGWPARCNFFMRLHLLAE